MNATPMHSPAPTHRTDLTESTAARFSPEEVSHFQENGYTIVRGLGNAALRETMLEVTREQLRQAVEPFELEADVHYPGSPDSPDAEGGRTIRRLLMTHARHPVFTRWLCRPELLGRLEQLLTAPVVMPLAHHNCIMTKQPRFSSRTLWHQDIRFWSFAQPDLVSVWVALGEETVENGCLQVIPGTHRMEFAPDRFDAGRFLDPEQPRNQELIDRKVSVTLQPGDVLFFHCRTFHAAGSNSTDQSKYSVVFTFRGADNHPLPGTRSSSLPELILPRAEAV